MAPSSSSAMAASIARRSNVAKSSSSVKYEIGNSYHKVPQAEAKRSRSGYPKIHDWTLYVDIVQGNADAIEYVTFHLGPKFNPPSYTCRSPVPVSTFTGQRAMRFQTRQQSSGQRITSRKVEVELQARGSKKASEKIEYVMRLKPGGSRGTGRSLECGVIKNEDFVPQPISSKGTFGIELEMSCARDNIDVSKAHFQHQHPGWIFKYDGSLACNRNNPNCSKFELVSPILSGSGPNGMASVKRALTTVHSTIGSIEVNKSMGFHVHVSVEGYNLKHLIKICQNFIKYENVIDTFMAVSRRGGGSHQHPNDFNRYCQTNRQAVPGSTNKEKHMFLARCRTLQDLSRAVNPEGRYYKLNLQNLVSGRQPTVEFRQHSSTATYSKIRNWISFCMALVHNSANLAPPSSLRDSRSVEDQFDMLFWFCIKDRGLRDYYQGRQEELKRAKEKNACCFQCGNGGDSCVKGLR